MNDEKQDEFLKDSHFLLWIYDRLRKKHGENPNSDYMVKFHNLIEKMSVKESNEDDEIPLEHRRFKYFLKYRNTVCHDLKNTTLKFIEEHTVAELSGAKLLDVGDSCGSDDDKFEVKITRVK